MNGIIRFAEEGEGGGTYQFVREAIKMVVIIERLEINDFKNIKGKTIDFGDFNIIIGPSNVGKSNILRAISISSKTIGGKIEVGHDHRFNCDVCTKIKEEISSHVEFLGGGYNLEKYDQFKVTGKTEITYNFNKELILYYWLNKNRSKIPEIFNYIQKSNPDFKSSQYIGNINQMLDEGLAKFIHSRNDAKETLCGNFAEYYINFLSSLLKDKKFVDHLEEDVKNSLFTVKLAFNRNAIAAEHISVLNEVQKDEKTIFYEIKDNVLYCPESRLNGYKGKTFPEYILRKFTKKDLDRFLEFICKVVGLHISDVAINCEDPKTMSFVFDDFETPIDEQGSGLRSIIGPAWDILTAKEGSIVIIDEPELGLHPSAKQEFLKKLLEEAENKQIFIATHDPTFVNPVIWQEFVREKDLKKFSVKVLLYSIYSQSFVNVDLDHQSKEDPETFAGYLPHTTSLKESHIYVEGPSDVCVFQIWLEKYLRSKYRRNWLKKFNGIGIYHLGGDNWMNLLYTIPREPYKCMVILDGDKAEEYLFSIGAGLKDDLNKSIVAEELMNVFKTKGVPISDSATVTKEKENKWVIVDEKAFIVRKEDGMLNIYVEKAKEICEKYNKAKFENIFRFKFCKDIGEISFDSDYHHPVYCLNREEIEYYFDPVLLTICIVDQSKLDSVPLNMEIKTIRELKDVCNDLFSLNETNSDIYEYQLEDIKLVIDLDQKALEIVENGETLLKLSEVDGGIEIEDIEIEDKVIYGSLIADKMDVPDEIRGIFDSILDKTESQRFQNHPISE